MLNLKSVVVLAEVKCIKYAMECRDTYNNMKIVRKASEQIKRKADYLARFEDFTEKFNTYLETIEACTDCSNTTEIGKTMDNAVKMYKHIRKEDIEHQC